MVRQLSAEEEEEYRQTVEAVREGMADTEAGRIVPVRELLEAALRECFHEPSGEMDKSRNPAPDDSET